jgi:gluconokinase
MMGVDKGKIYVVMGVSGSGKSTIAPLLAQALELPYFDGDDFHPPANVAKMASGQPLTDTDRHLWLVTLNRLAKNNLEKGAVIVCSALKESHRSKLGAGIEKRVVWVFLKGTFDLISERLGNRKGHFMPPSLLASQFETLEIPKNALEISVQGTPEEITGRILGKLKELY